MVFFHKFIEQNNSIQCIALNTECCNLSPTLFYIEKLNEKGSLPSISFSYDMDYHDIIKVINLIINQGKIETPFGDIDTSFGLIFKEQEIKIPILKEIVKDDNNNLNEYDVFELLRESTMHSTYSPNKINYYDYYFTKVDINKLKELKDEINIDGIIFKGFNENGIMEFDFEGQRFQINQFIGTGYRNVYFPMLKFDQSISIETINKIANILFKNKSFNFNDDIGSISFKNGMVLNINNLIISINEATKDSLNQLLAVLNKEKIENKDKFQGLDSLFIAKYLQKSNKEIVTEKQERIGLLNTIKSGFNKLLKKPIKK